MDVYFGHGDTDVLRCSVQGDAEFKQKQKEQQKALEEAKAKAAGKGPIGKFSSYISFMPENARLT